jgi:hypothetical protein
VEDIVERESCGKGVEDIVQKKKGVPDIVGCGGYYGKRDEGRVWRILCRRGRVWRILWRMRVVEKV